MSQNNHLDAAWQYHSGTKHSQLSVRMSPHFLDWDNKPLLFKIYPTLEVLRLPRDFRETGRAALDAIAMPERASFDRGYSRSRNAGAIALFLCRSHSQQETRARRNLLSRRGLHRRSLRNRTLRRLYRSKRRIRARRERRRALRRASTISASPSSACANCGPATSGRRWSKPRRAIHPLRMLRLPSSAPGRTGATPGNTAPAPIATSDGITAPSLPIFWRCPKPQICLPKL